MSEYNQKEDYKFRIVAYEFWRIKRIGIYLPKTVYTVGSSKDCIETIESQIQVERCWIDQNSGNNYYIIWIHISKQMKQYIAKLDYSSSGILEIQTTNLLFTNPSSGYCSSSCLDVILETYTWIDSLDDYFDSYDKFPGSSSDYPIYQSESFGASTSASDLFNSLTNTKPVPPTLLFVPQERYIDDYPQLGNSYSGDEYWVPIQFDICAPTNLNYQQSIAGSTTSLSAAQSAMHKLTIDLPSQLSMPSCYSSSPPVTSYSGDLIKCKLVCSVEGSNQYCSYSSSQIILYTSLLQQGQYSHIKLAVVQYFDTTANPSPNTMLKEGFVWQTGTALSSINHLKVLLTYFYTSSATKDIYYISDKIGMHAEFSEAGEVVTRNYVSSFKASYISNRIGGEYPTYLSLKMQFISTDIQWLVFEFYTVDADGTIQIYNEPLLTINNLRTSPSDSHLKSGQNYPCTYDSTLAFIADTSNNQDLMCVYKEGDVKNKGTPHRILVTNFKITAINSQGQINFLITNPTAGRPLRIGLKAYGRIPSSNNGEFFSNENLLGWALIENALFDIMGYWEVFQASTSTTPFSTVLNFSPNLPPGQYSSISTNHYLTFSKGTLTSTYKAIFQFPLKSVISRYGSWSNNEPQEICTTSLDRSKYFIVEDNLLNKVYGIYFQQSAGTYKLPQVNCIFYPSTDENSNYLWYAYFADQTTTPSITVEKYYYQVDYTSTSIDYTSGSSSSITLEYSLNQATQQTVFTIVNLNLDTDLNSLYSRITSNSAPIINSDTVFGIRIKNLNGNGYFLYSCDSASVTCRCAHLQGFYTNSDQQPIRCLEDKTISSKRYYLIRNFDLFYDPSASTLRNIQNIQVLFEHLDPDTSSNYETLPITSIEFQFYFWTNMDAYYYQQPQFTYITNYYSDRTLPITSAYKNAYMSSISNRYGTVSVKMYSGLTSQDSVYFDSAGTLYINILTQLRSGSNYIGVNGGSFYVGLKPASFTGFSASSFYYASMYVNDATQNPSSQYTIITNVLGLDFSSSTYFTLTTNGLKITKNFIPVTSITYDYLFYVNLLDYNDNIPLFYAYLISSVEEFLCQEEYYGYFHAFAKINTMSWTTANWVSGTGYTCSSYTYPFGWWWINGQRICCEFNYLSSSSTTYLSIYANGYGICLFNTPGTNNGYKYFKGYTWIEGEYLQFQFKFGNAQMKYQFLQLRFVVAYDDYPYSDDYTVYGYTPYVQDKLIIDTYYPAGSSTSSPLIRDLTSSSTPVKVLSIANTGYTELKLTISNIQVDVEKSFGSTKTNRGQLFFIETTDLSTSSQSFVYAHTMSADESLTDDNYVKEIPCLCYKGTSSLSSWSSFDGKCYSHYQEPYSSTPSSANYPYGISIITALSTTQSSLICYIAGLYFSGTITSQSVNVKLVNHQERYFKRGSTGEYGAIYAALGIGVGTYASSCSSNSIVSGGLSPSGSVTISTSPYTYDLTITASNTLNNFVILVVFSQESQLTPDSSSCDLNEKCRIYSKNGVYEIVIQDSTSSTTYTQYSLKFYTNTYQSTVVSDATKYTIYLYNECGGNQGSVQGSFSTTFPTSYKPTFIQLESSPYGYAITNNNRGFTSDYILSVKLSSIDSLDEEDGLGILIASADTAKYSGDCHAQIYQLKGTWLECSIFQYDTTNHYQMVFIKPYPGTTISSNGIVQIYFTIVNPTASQLQFEIFEYKQISIFGITSLKSNSRITAQNLDASTNQISLLNLGSISAANLGQIGIYPFASKIYGQSTNSAAIYKTPIRFFFETASASSSADYIQFWIKGDSSQPYAGITSTIPSSLTCKVRFYNDFTTGNYYERIVQSTLLTACGVFTSGNDIYFQSILPEGYQGTFSTKKWEVIFQPDIDTLGIGFKDIQLDSTKWKFYYYNSASTLLKYQEGRMYKAQFYDKLTQNDPIVMVPKFYITSLAQGTETSVYLSLNLNFPSGFAAEPSQATTILGTLNNAMKFLNYVELILDGLEMTTSSIGGEINCGYQYDFTATQPLYIRQTGETLVSPTGIFPSNTTEYDSDKLNQFRCVVSQYTQPDVRRKYSNPLLVRLEWIDYFTSSQVKIKLGIDGLSVSSITSSQKDEFRPIDIDINYYQFDYTNSKYAKLYTKIQQVATINQFATTVSSSTFFPKKFSFLVQDPNTNALEMDQGKSALTYRLLFEYNPSSSIAEEWSGTETTYSTTTTPSRGSKLLLNFGVDFGPFSIYENHKKLFNSNNPIKFVEYNCGVSSTTAYNILWINPKANVVLLETPDRTSYSSSICSNPLEIRITNVNNPQSMEISTYQGSLPSPGIPTEPDSLILAYLHLQLYLDYNMQKQKYIAYPGAKEYFSQSSSIAACHTLDETSLSSAINPYQDCFEPLSSSGYITMVFQNYLTNQWFFGYFQLVSATITFDSSFFSITNYQYIILKQIYRINIIFTSGISNIDYCHILYNYDTKFEALFCQCRQFSLYNDPSSAVSDGAYPMMSIFGFQPGYTYLSDTVTIYMFAQIDSSPVYFIYRVYDYEDNLIMVSTSSYNPASKGFTQDTTIKKTTQFSQLNKMYTKWYSEIHEKKISVGDTTTSLNFIFKPSQQLLKTNADYLTITLDDSASYVPQKPLFNSYLLCFFTPILKTYSQLGYPIKASSCNLVSGTPNYYYEIYSPLDNLPWDFTTGKTYSYLLTIIQDTKGLDTSSPPLYTETNMVFVYPSSPQLDEFYFQVYSGTNLINYDMLRLNIELLFQTITLRHVSLTQNEFDHLVLAFTMNGNQNFPYPASGTNENVLAIEIRSEIFYSDSSTAFQKYQDCDTRTTSLDIDRTYYNGYTYSGRIACSAASLDDGKYFILQYGQWYGGSSLIVKSPIRVIFVPYSTTQLTKTSSYIIKIPLLRNPKTPYYEKFSARLKLISYNQFSPEIFSSYEFINYATIDSTIPKAITPQGITASSSQADTYILSFSAIFLGASSSTTASSNSWIMFQWDMQVDGALVDKVAAGTATIVLANAQYGNIIMSNCDYFKEFYMHLCRVTTKYVFDLSLIHI
eukprot:TRINITY_DN1674_c0_g1_i8.p1 TRINITY_DN1674_c0_g1~~TRINITY_DN1674_c0_g1_i8.p1  ORF type:complete len:3019 (-),score=359.49 TRINITY_DN1674_c0_g1_i8:54-9110(-)